MQDGNPSRGSLDKGNYKFKPESFRIVHTWCRALHTVGIGMNNILHSREKLLKEKKLLHIDTTQLHTGIETCSCTCGSRGQVGFDLALNTSNRPEINGINTSVTTTFKCSCSQFEEKYPAMLQTH